MAKRLARILLPLTCACACASAALPPTGDAKLVVGIGDNSPAMFSEPTFLKTNIKTARYIAYWNVAVLKDHKYLNAVRGWLNAASAAGVTPMVSFTGNGSYVPTVGAYTKAVQAFMKDFPQVKIFTAWNEPDWIYLSLSKHPTLAAAYFNVMERYCHHCTLLAGDVYRRADQGLASWVRAYAKGLHYKPSGWAIHPYDDIRGHTTSQLQAFQSVTSGPIWFTEISGVLRRGHWQFKNQSGTAAASDEKFLFSLPKRYPRIARIYHYQWQGTVPSPDTGWDSGLLGPQGTPRPAYWVDYNAAHGKLP